MSRPFVVNVGAIKRQVGNVASEHCEGPIGEVVVGDSTISADAVVSANIELRAAYGGIDVKGEATVPWHSQCRRCLVAIEGTTTTNIGEFVREINDDDEEASESETYQFEGDELDLEPLIRDAIVLALPLTALCREDCAGLCPNCGINRNESTCDCEIDLRDPRWSALDELREE